MTTFEKKLAESYSVHILFLRQKNFENQLRFIEVAIVCHYEFGECLLLKQNTL